MVRTPRQHEVAEGTGDELAIGLEQHHLDARDRPMRTYFAAVAPPQPPPMTTTRRRPVGCGLPARGGAAGQAAGGRGAREPAPLAV